MTQQIQDLIAKAETGEQWAEICRLEAEQLGGPFYCQTCGAELSSADRLGHTCEVQS